MIAKPPSWSPLPAAPAERERSATALPPEERGRGFSMTSHSFTLNTKLFNLDLSWRRLEVDARNQPNSIASTGTEMPSPPQTSKSRPDSPTFSEVLKRQQLASLLMDSVSPPDDSLETIQAGTNGPNPTFAGSAHRAYRRVSPNGPLTGDRTYKA